MCQIGALQAIAQDVDSAVSYIKKLGALHNAILTNHEQGSAVGVAIHRMDHDATGVRLGRIRLFSTRIRDLAYAGLRRRLRIAPTGLTSSWFFGVNPAQC